MGVFDSESVAKELNIPLLAVGQLVFEGRLRPSEESLSFSFNKNDVKKLKDTDLSKYR